VRPPNLLRPPLKTKRSGELEESVLLEMMDKSLRVKLVMASLLEHNVNQQISLFHLRSFNSTRKVNVDESFVSHTFNPDTAYQTPSCWAGLSLQFR